jgi:hypothetical protein
MIVCNQKERVQESYSPMRYPPRTLVLILWRPNSHPQAPTLSYCELPTCLISDPVRSELRQTQQHKTQHNHTALIIPYTQMHPRKCLDSHYQIMYIVREHKHCPRTQFLTNRGFDHSSKLTLFLSPRYSCSNELNHTSDEAEDHDHGYKLSATELQNLFLSLSLYSPHHNIVYFLPQTDPSLLLSPFTSTHYPPDNLSIILQTEALPFTRHRPDCSPASSSSGLIPYQTPSNRLVFFFTLPNRHSS